MNKQTRTYGFRITTERWADKPCVVVRVLAREGEHHSPINPRSEGESVTWDAPRHADGLMLKGLTIRAYASDITSSPVIVRSPEFEDAHYVGGHEAAAMLKTFRRIDRELAKQCPGERDLGDYVEAVGKAIGAGWTVFEARKGHGWDYASSEWNFAPLSSAKVEARIQVSDLMPKAPEPKSDVPDYVDFQDDVEGLSEHKRDMADKDGTLDRARVVLEACAYQKGNPLPIRTLGDIDFFVDQSDWTRGRFCRVSDIPAACDHQRSIARDMGLPE